MSVREIALEKLANSIEKIADNGIDVHLIADGRVESEKMALDLAAMKISDSLHEIASALYYNAADKE